MTDNLAGLVLIAAGLALCLAAQRRRTAVWDAARAASQQAWDAAEYERSLDLLTAPHRSAREAAVNAVTSVAGGLMVGIGLGTVIA